jgi:hypothetical protein
MEGAESMNIRSIAVCAFLVAGLSSAQGIQAQETKIRRSELPPAVEKTLTQESNGATVRGFSTEVENGKRIYEAELTINGHGKDISMDEHGNVVEVEEEVSMNALPPAVRAGLIQAAGKGTIGTVESITKDGKLVAYEAVAKSGTKRTEVQVAPDGKKLAHPE